MPDKKTYQLSLEAGMITDSANRTFRTNVISNTLLNRNSSDFAPISSAGIPLDDIDIFWISDDTRTFAGVVKNREIHQTVCGRSYQIYSSHNAGEFIKYIFGPQIDGAEAAFDKAIAKIRDLITAFKIAEHDKLIKLPEDLYDQLKDDYILCQTPPQIIICHVGVNEKGRPLTIDLYSFFVESADIESLDIDIYNTLFPIYNESGKSSLDNTSSMLKNDVYKNILVDKTEEIEDLFAAYNGSKNIDLQVNILSMNNALRHIFQQYNTYTLPTGNDVYQVDTNFIESRFNDSHPWKQKLLDELEKIEGKKFGTFEYLLALAKLNYFDEHENFAAKNFSHAGKLKDFLDEIENPIQDLTFKTLSDLMEKNVKVLQAKPTYAIKAVGAQKKVKAPLAEDDIDIENMLKTIAALIEGDDKNKEPF